MSAEKQVDGSMFELSSVEDQLETGYTKEIAAVMRDERYRR